MPITPADAGLPDTPGQWGGAALISAVIGLGTWAVTQYLAVRRARGERDREDAEAAARASKGDFDLDKEEALFSDKRWVKYIAQVEKKAEQLEARGAAERARLEKRIEGLESEVNRVLLREHACEKAMAVLKEQVVWLRQAAEDKEAVLRANGLVGNSDFNRVNERFPTEATVAERRTHPEPDAPIKTRKEDPPSSPGLNRIPHSSE